MKWDADNKGIAGDLLAFIDDLRASGHSVEKAWAIARQVGSRLQYLGLQDAPRKRRLPTLTPGAWAGSMFKSSEEDVIQMVTQATKWDKAKAQIAKVIRECKEGEGDPMLDYKQLEEIQGFLGHLAMTYDIVGTYLKGFHLTLASIHPQRDQEGWKVPKREWLSYLWNAREEGKLSTEE
jgi:hypothetical protein